VFVDGIITAVCTDPVTARRVAELVERHGLVDVPDNAAGAQ
jgi:Trk K+ transport system NAD-binding subunit